jgi:hypothetical protein
MSASSSAEIMGLSGQAPLLARAQGRVMAQGRSRVIVLFFLAKRPRPIQGCGSTPHRVVLAETMNALVIITAMNVR